MIPRALNFVKAEPWPASAVKVPRWQAHRGFWSAGFQENTIPAFRAAKAAGFQMAELDVQLTKDHQVVVFHDEDLRRLGGGRSTRVRDLTAAELGRLCQAPLLREVLLDAQGVASVNIEIKAPLSNAGKIEPLVAQVIQDSHAEGRVMISSFNPLSLVLMAELLPQVPRALLATDRLEPGNSFLLRHLMLAPFLRIHALNLEAEMVTPDVVSLLRAREIPFSLWTVDDRPKADMLLDGGAQSVITNQKLF